MPAPFVIQGKQMKRKKTNKQTQTPERRMNMRKRLAQLAEFLNKQTDRNNPMTFFYTGFVTLLIILILYYLYILLIDTSIFKYLTYGIMIYLSVSTLGAFVVGMLNGLFDD